jgi:hypothetical protein
VNVQQRIEQADLDLDRNTVEQRLEVFREISPQPGHVADRDIPLPETMTVVDGVPEVRAEDFRLQHLIAGMEIHGLLIVRGLLNEGNCETYRGVIDKVLDAPRATPKNQLTEEAVRSPYHNAPRNLADYFDATMLGKARGYHRLSGTGMCVESAAVSEQLLDLYNELGLKQLIGDYLGEEPCVSAQKWVLRRTQLPLEEADWHQDGSFMGAHIKSLNMWLALCDCGGDTGAAGLEIIPQRIREVFRSPEGIYDWSLTPQWVAENQHLAPAVSPTFSAGDAVFFDHFSLHRTQHHEQMDKHRYAIETWFFGSKSFPKEQVPMAW